MHVMAEIRLYLSHKGGLNSLFKIYVLFDEIWVVCTYIQLSMQSGNNNNRASVSCTETRRAKEKTRMGAQCDLKGCPVPQVWLIAGA